MSDLAESAARRVLRKPVVQKKVGYGPELNPRHRFVGLVSLSQAYTVLWVYYGDYEGGV